MAGLFHIRREPQLLVKLMIGGSCLGLLLLIWLIVTSGDIPEERTVSPAILPSPGEVVFSVEELLEERGLLRSIGATLRRVFLGFGLAACIGVPLGMIAGSWRAINAFFAPVMMFGRNVPIAALIPLTMAWFGIDESQKVMFIFIATLPFIFVDSAAAVGSIKERYVETGQTLGASPRQLFTKILVPLSLPDIYTKLRHLFGLAFGYIMLAELVNTRSGLGLLLRMSERRGQTEAIFFILILITLLAVAIDRTLVFFQRGLFPYRKDL